MQKVSVLIGILCACTLMSSAAIRAEEVTVIRLPAPETKAGKPLMEAYALRRSMRSFSSQDISLQTLSNLLWAANGVNRPQSGGRTAPSACNFQEIDVYVARADGAYRYHAGDHVLERIIPDDIRAITGKQGFTQDAPLCLIYVCNYARMNRKGMAQRYKEFYAATDTGFVSQNVYLYCASEGLATVVLGMVDKPALGSALRLKKTQQVILTQPVGYPE